jgi:hypothetical protein
MNTHAIPRPVSGGLMLSYKCSAQCRHCMYACSPDWEADWISVGHLEAGLSVLARYIQPSPWGKEVISLNHGLHFTGGEPFLNYTLLLTATEIASELGIPSLFVETNCYWCRDDASTREKLAQLQAAGLDGIMISVNPFYAEYIPFERTERCIRVSQEVFGRNMFVYQMDYYRQFKRLGIQDRISLEAYMDLVPGERLAQRVEMFLMGRAARQLRAFYPKYPARTFFGEPCRPSFLRAWHNHFDNYDNFMPGYCGGISLGNWFELDELTSNGVDPGTHPLLGLLIAEDVEGLLRFAEAMGYHPTPEGYLSKCDLCLDIRRYLVTQDEFPELQPRAFYEHLV